MLPDVAGIILTDVIVEASSPSHYEAFSEIIRDYVEWSRERCRDFPVLRELIFDARNFDQERAALSRLYGPPEGKTLLAMRDGAACGAVAYRRLSDDVCEMKRMFVRQHLKGQGIGRKLCMAILAEARKDGFSWMRLDSIHLLVEAHEMYRSLGFAARPPYHDYPEQIAPFMVYMEKPLMEKPLA